MAKFYVGLQRSGKKHRSMKRVGATKVIRGPLPGYAKMSDTLEDSRNRFFRCSPTT